MAPRAARSRSRARFGRRRRRVKRCAVTRRREPRHGRADLRWSGRAGRMGYLLDGSHWNPSNPMGIPNLIVAHAYLTLISVGIGLLIAFPISLFISRTVSAKA